MAALPGSAPLSASRAGSNPLAGYVRGYAWLRPDRRTFFESLAQWCGASCANWPCLYLEPTARQSLNLWGSRGSNSPQADYEPAAFTRLLDPRPVAATILEARRPPWSAPKHADHSRPGPKKRHAAGQSAGPQMHGPLHRCKAAPASPGHQTAPAHPLASQPAGEGVAASVNAKRRIVRQAIFANGQRIPGLKPCFHYVQVRALWPTGPRSTVVVGHEKLFVEGGRWSSPLPLRGGSSIASRVMSS